MNEEMLEELAGLREECLILAILLFDREEDGSFKDENLEFARSRIDDDDNNEVVWISMLTVRLALIAGVLNEESPAIIMGQWAGILMASEVEMFVNAMKAFQERARLN